MHKNKLVKRLIVAGLIAAMPVVGLVQGCGGGNDSGPSVPANAFVGNYSGTYRVTAGQDRGETGRFTLRVNADGTSTGGVTDASGGTANITGTTNLSSGAFTLTGVFDSTGTAGRASGTLRTSGSSVTGTGTFELTNGNSGTISIAKS